MPHFSIILQEIRGRAMSESKEQKFAELSRREFMGIAAATAAGFRRPAQAQSSAARAGESLPPYGNGTIQTGIRSRNIANVNGLSVHILEAGFETPGRP